MSDPRTGRAGTRERRGWIVLGLLLLLQPACLGSLELSRVESEIRRQLPGAEFEKSMRLDLGPMTLGLARFVTAVIPRGAVPEAREAHEYLEEIHRVQVAIYRTVALPEVTNLHMPAPLRRLIRDDDWHLAVKTQTPEELLWVLSRQEGPVVRELYVVSLTQDDLVIVRVAGRMNALLAKAMENHAGDLPGPMGIRLD